MKTNLFTFRHGPKQSITLLTLIILGLGISSQAWATDACYFTNGAMSITYWKTGYSGDDTKEYGASGVSHLNLGESSNIRLKKWWTKLAKNDGNICVDNSYMHYAIYKDGERSSAKWIVINRTSYNWFDDSKNIYFEYWNSEGIKLDEGLNNGSYHFEYYFTTSGALNATTGCYQDCFTLNNGGTNYYIDFSCHNNTVVTFGAGIDSKHGLVICTKKNASTTYTSEVPKETTVVFTADPSDGWELDGWYSDAACNNLVSSDAAYEVTISGDTYAIYAKFKPLSTVTLTGFTKESVKAGTRTKGSAILSIPAGKELSGSVAATGGVTDLSHDGNNYTFKASAAGSLTATYVYKKPGVTCSNATFILGGAAVKLNPTYTDVAADATYQWTGENVTFSPDATVANPNVSVSSAGNYSISVTVTQGGQSTTIASPITLTATAHSGDKCGTCFDYKGQ